MEPARREATLAAITTAARRLLVDEGMQAVGLRAVARAVGMTAPALYRYVDNPQQLIELVAGQACRELTETILAAAESAGPAPTDRLEAASRAFRRWALDHRPEFGTVFANPALAVDQGSKARFAHAFAGLFADVWREIPASHRSSIAIDGELVRHLRDADLDLPDDARLVFLWCWSRLYGAVCLEAFGQLQWILDDGEPLFDATLTEIGARLAP